MRQVRLEPTTSRLPGEVTLSCTTSNFFFSGTDFSLCSPPRREPPTSSQFAPDKSNRICRGGACPARLPNFAGRNSRAELRSLSPASFHRRSNSPPRHPGISVAQPTPFHRAFFARRILAVRHFLFALTSLPLYISSEHTYSLPQRSSLHPAKLLLLKIPGGISAHGLSGFEPEPFGLATEVTVNFAIPGMCRSQKNFRTKGAYAVPVARISLRPATVSPPRKNTLATNGIGSKRLRRQRNELTYGRVNKQSTRPNRPGAVSTWFLSSCLIFAFHAQ